MNAIKIIGTLIVGLLVVFVTRIIFLLTPVLEKIQASPWWIYAIIFGIFVSGYLSFKYTKDERELEQIWIEKEGEVFMEPIRNRRQNKLTVNE
jgi:predicted tellurium resistance membrane protein TerC